MTTFYDLLKDKGIKPSQLADAIRVNKGNVSHWNRSRVPVDRVPAVERATGIPRHVLRPDLWEAPKAERAAS